MPKYAHPDPTVDPNLAHRVTRWYDTDFAYYPNRPPMSELLQVSEDLWLAHCKGQEFAYRNGKLIPFDLKTVSGSTTITQPLILDLPPD